MSEFEWKNPTCKVCGDNLRSYAGKWVHADPECANWNWNHR